MKKSNRFFAMLLAMLISASLCAGCSDAPAEEADTPVNPPAVSEPVESTPDETVVEQTGSQLESVYAKVVESGVLPAMFVLGDAYIESYYGITADAMSDGIFAVAEDSLLADTVIVVKVSETGDAAAIESTFNNINNQKKLELESYNPTQFERVNNAVIKNVNGYVYYIVTDDNAAVAQLIESNIG